VNRYLTIADKHHIQTMFVFFDDCWNPDPKIGKQQVPTIGKHNSGWAQDPGYIVTKSDDFAFLQKYVTDILTTFKDDKRILLWDLYNEPGNSKKGLTSLPLLTKVFIWARAVNPEQPISVGLWKMEFETLNAVQLLNSDIITYHDYEAPEWHLRVVQMLKSHGRPLICTEYMARKHKSTFVNSMPMLKREHVGAINWGLVAGKTNTMYAWDEPHPDGSEPSLWFHEVFRNDGTPYKQEEVDIIKKLNNK
ncbi:MAG: 1,4-beta-xylanase, partial [Sphingobacteriaceae bacterium]